VVFLSAKTGDEDKVLEMGGVGYLTKPVKSALLMESIKTHLVPKARG
jgi:DNA-binding response OmpR family regulator